MTIISATKLRQNLFEYLDRVAAGETIVIQRNDKEVARLVGSSINDWRTGMKQELKLLVSAEQLLEPLTDVWGDYL